MNAIYATNRWKEIVDEGADEVDFVWQSYAKPKVHIYIPLLQILNALQLHLFPSATPSPPNP